MAAAAPVQSWLESRLCPPSAGGTRRDGRKGNELRPQEARWGGVSNADGAVWLQHGRTAVMATVVGPTAAPAGRAPNTAVVGPSALDDGRCVVRVLVARLQPAPPMCGGPGRGVQQQHRAARTASDAALEQRLTSVFGSGAVVCREQYLRCCVTITVTVLSDDGGLVAAAANAAMCALLNAGIACRSTVAAITLTKFILTNNSNNKNSSAKPETLTWLDPTAEELSHTQRQAWFFPASSAASAQSTAQSNNNNNSGGMVVTALDATFITLQPSPSADGSASIAAMDLQTYAYQPQPPQQQSGEGAMTTAFVAASCSVQDVESLAKVADKCCAAGVIAFMRDAMAPTSTTDDAATAADNEGEEGTEQKKKESEDNDNATTAAIA